MIRKWVMFKIGIIVYIAISGRWFVFSQSHVKVPTSLYDVGGLTVGARIGSKNRSLYAVTLLFGSFFS